MVWTVYNLDFTWTINLHERVNVSLELKALIIKRKYINRTYFGTGCVSHDCTQELISSNDASLTKNLFHNIVGSSNFCKLIK